MSVADDEIEQYKQDIKAYDQQIDHLEQQVKRLEQRETTLTASSIDNTREIEKLRRVNRYYEEQRLLYMNIASMLLRATLATEQVQTDSEDV